MSSPPPTKPDKKRSKGRSRRAPDAGMNIGSLSQTAPIPAGVDKSPQSLSELAQNLSLDTGLYVDTRFFVFSRRKHSGVLFAPRAVYANSWILRAKLPSYFDPLLRGGFDGGSVTGPLHSPVPKELAGEFDSYDYDSDSDLEDEEDEQAHDTETSSQPSGLEKKDDGGKEDNNSAGSGTEPSDAPTFALGTGKTLLMCNCAYTTWKALVFYIYTGKITFAPLKSQRTRQGTDTHPGLLATPPICSPKSMYRLADELGFEELKKKAFVDIESKLAPGNILEELFTTITSRYTEIREMEITYAYNNARTDVNAKVVGIIDNMDADDFKCSATVISRLLQKFSSPLPPPIVPKQTATVVCTSAYNCSPSHFTCRNCNTMLTATIT